MPVKQKFTAEEWDQIGKSKHRLKRIPIIEDQLKRLVKKIQETSIDLAGLGYRGIKLSPLNGNGCKPRGYNTAITTLIVAMIGIRDDLIRKKNAAEAELEKIVRTLPKMPTKLYSEILIQKYITRAKTTKQISNMRYKHLDDALLEYYHSWKD